MQNYANGHDLARLSISVGIAVGHQYLREGLRAVLGNTPGIDVIGVAADGAAAIRIVSNFRPQILIASTELPGYDSLALLRELRLTSAGTLPIIMFRHSEMPDVRAFVRAGARGLVPDDYPIDDLATAVRTAVSGHLALAPHIVTMLTTEPAPPPSLTRRESQLLQLIADGRSNSEIGMALGIGVKTVDTHRRSLYRKLGAHNTGELLMRALRAGLIAA
jgi:DNA-binding NarL/FixJ family response regulator